MQYIIPLSRKNKGAYYAFNHFRKRFAALFRFQIQKPQRRKKKKQTDCGKDFYFHRYILLIFHNII